MKLVKMSYKPIAGITMTMEDIDGLIELSGGHYDGVCQKAGKVGGFLYGMKAYQSYNPYAIHDLDNRQIQTLIKITEVGLIPSGSFPTLADLLGLKMGLQEVLKKMNNYAPTPDKFNEDGYLIK